MPRRLEEHLSQAWGLPVRITGWRRFPVGMSWITIGFVATLGPETQPLETRDLILRLGDPKGLFAPYSTKPEYVALTALSNVPGLPVPKVWLRCEDPAVLGAPFIVTQRVAGDTPTPWSRSFENDEARRISLAEQFSDALGALHGFDWRETPLAAWAHDITPETTAIRETQRWAGIAGYPAKPLPPQMQYAMRWLQANAPVSQRIVVVHGDYRVGNFLQQDGRITAILDWELVHLGDAHEDLAWAALRAFANGSSRIGGLVDTATFHERHKALSGLDVDERKLRYYQVLMQFKSAAMLLGASRRVDEGRSSDVRMAAMGFQLAPTLMELNRLIEEAS